jgi:RNA polymerase sigma-70 factor (ECF subfamily)
MLYKHFYGYAMSICMRYTHNYEDAKEVLNDSFMKVFLRIDQYNDKYHFKAWFRKIIVNSSIDYIKKEIKNKYHHPIEEMNIPESPDGQQHSFSQEELLLLVSKLSPAYRSVFNLYVIDGFNHQEISKMLGISVGTSKSNLAKARMRLKELLFKIDKDEYARYAG